MTGNVGVRFITVAICGTVAVAAVGGVAAMLAGGSFSELGSGAGGLWGVPSVGTTVLALTALPIAVVLAVRSRHVGKRRSSVESGAAAGAEDGLGPVVLAGVKHPDAAVARHAVKPVKVAGGMKMIPLVEQAHLAGDRRRFRGDRPAKLLPPFDPLRNPLES